jgi:glycosyltransferase involved in cell wall biosynthesis
MTDAVLVYLAGDALVGIVAFQAVVLLVVAQQRRPLVASPTLGVGAAAMPRVSLLVPARNEEANIGACVRSLLAQTYPRLEILVLDDRSEDATRRSSRSAGARPPARGAGGRGAAARLDGQELGVPPLALAATGEVLLFADADTVFVDPDAVDGIVGTLRASRADLVSGLPNSAWGRGARRCWSRCSTGRSSRSRRWPWRASGVGRREPAPSGS